MSVVVSIPRASASPLAIARPPTTTVVASPPHAPNSQTPSFPLQGTGEVGALDEALARFAGGLPLAALRPLGDLLDRGFKGGAENTGMLVGCTVSAGSEDESQFRGRVCSP